MVGGGEVETEPADRPLSLEAAILCRLHRGPAGLELVLGRAGLLASIEQPALKALQLRRGAAMAVASLAPLLPHDASSQQLEPCCRLGCLPGRRGLGAERLEPRSELGLQILEAKQVRGQLLQPLQSLLPPLLDPAHLSRLFQQLTPLRGRADHDVLDVVLIMIAYESTVKPVDERR